MRIIRVLNWSMYIFLVGSHFGWTENKLPTKIHWHIMCDMKCDMKWPKIKGCTNHFQKYQSSWCWSHAYIHYITLHYITLHYIPFHCIALHCITWHYITFSYIYIYMYMSSINYTIYIWSVVEFLWKTRVRQLGWFYIPNISGVKKTDVSKFPNRQAEMVFPSPCNTPCTTCWVPWKFSCHHHPMGSSSHSNLKSW